MTENDLLLFSIRDQGLSLLGLRLKYKRKRKVKSLRSLLINRSCLKLHLQKNLLSSKSFALSHQKPLVKRKKERSKLRNRLKLLYLLLKKRRRSLRLITFRHLMRLPRLVHLRQRCQRNKLLQLLSPLSPLHPLSQNSQLHSQTTFPKVSKSLQPHNSPSNKTRQLQWT